MPKVYYSKSRFMLINELSESNFNNLIKSGVIEIVNINGIKMILSEKLNKQKKSKK